MTSWPKHWSTPSRDYSSTPPAGHEARFKAAQEPAERIEALEGEEEEPEEDGDGSSSGE